MRGRFPNTLTACAMFSLGVAGVGRYNPTAARAGSVVPPHRASEPFGPSVANGDRVIPLGRDIPLADAVTGRAIRHSSGYIFGTGCQ